MIAKRSFPMILAALFVVLAQPVLAMDSEITRRTLSGLPGFYIAFEELQANIKQYGVAASMTRDHLLKDVEVRLEKAGMKVFSQAQWMNTQGRPVLYVNVNTHLKDAYIAYDIRVEARQIVFTDSNKRMKTLAGTWGISITGMTRTDRMDVIRQDLFTLIDKFTEAYWAVNDKNEKK